MFKTLAAWFRPKYKVDIFKNDKGQYYFHLAAVNGEKIAQSEGYKHKQSCMDTVNKYFAGAVVRDFSN